MPDLADKIADAEAELARLKALAANKSCSEGHIWKHVGGKNAGCDDSCRCSVPVHQCTACGDFDYGDNDDAREIVSTCRDLWGSKTDA